ncbi:MAG: hypothetical protein JO340_05750 [Acidobacteriaceae bacterium]|nr:hypothetical protein [Acidobacteriaceae bacterium]
MSAHEHAVNVPVPEIRLGPGAAQVERISGIIGVIGLALCVVGFLMNRAVFFQSYLFAFIYWGGFALGGLGVLLMGHTVGGKWCATSRRFLEAQMGTLWIVAVFTVILLFGLHDLYPWTHIGDMKELADREVLRHKQGYLNIPFFVVRVVIYFAVWFFWGLRVRRMADRQDQTGDPTLRERMRAFSAPGVLVFTMTATFAYIDWILSADAQFFSTVYGAMILIGDVLQSFALTIMAMILTSRGDRFGGRVNAIILHDLGNLMFAFTIFWTYLTASQLIIVWPANLPQELIWYLNRVHGFWKYFALVTALSMFAIPFLALLSQTRKRDPRRLIRVCVWLLLARIIDIYWIVEPTYRRHGFWMSWTDFAAFFGVGGIWLFVFVRQLRQRPLLPLRDPRVMAPLPEEVVA